LFKEDLGDKLIAAFDETGAPSSTSHRLLYDLDEHVQRMDEAGIDAAFLTSAAGMCADIERSRLINENAKKAERDYPGRFIGAAHAHPLGGVDSFKELARCAHELGFPGAVITSEMNGLFVDAPEFEPFWTEVAKLNLFVLCIRHSS
jgi:predicted TIM-barrel fold metal-dependent hydrolase